MMGMPIQPKTLPTHQTRGVFPKASRKFSVPMESISVRQMTFTRFFGAGRRATSTLPASVARPDTALTQPSTVSPPWGRESNRAGRAAL